jgi:glycosyltransferase involved in cell wall biosynthesis
VAGAFAMVIGVNCFLLKNTIGGLRQYFHRLFRELLKGDNKNTYVFFYFEHNIDELQRLKDFGWEKHAIKLQDQNQIADHLKDIDLYFCPFGAIWPRPVPVPSVVNLVDIQEKYYPQFFDEESLWNRDYHYVASTKSADRVITISNFSKSSIVKFHGINPRKIHVAYLSASRKYYKPLGKEKKSGLNLPDEFVFYPANRWMHKNHDALLKAIQILKKQKRLLINCVFTGHDCQNGYPLNQKALDYGIGEQTKTVGYVSTEELRQIYSRAKMLCFPSLFEGFGMPIVEAMASECPVISSDATSLPEVVGDAGLMFNPEAPEEIAEKILLLYKDKEIRNRLIEKGKLQAQKFNPEKTAEIHRIAFAEAASCYRKSRYIYYKTIYEPIHKYRMRKKMDF